jgi:hypothetical protein
VKIYAQFSAQTSGCGDEQLVLLNNLGDLIDGGGPAPTAERFFVEPWLETPLYFESRSLIAKDISEESVRDFDS